MSDLFDPFNLLPEASLNRTVLPAVPGVPKDMVGSTGQELLAAAALATIEPDRRGIEVVGARVAALLCALRRGDPETGLGMEPTLWRQQYLSYWRRVEHVAIGGGMAQRFGPGVADVANRTLRAAGLDAPSVQVPEHAAWLPMIGAARSAGRSKDTLVLDLGHTSVKRGIATHDGAGALVRIEMFSPVAVDQRRTPPSEATRFVREVVQSSLLVAPDVAGVAASVAAYVTANGVIADARTYYQSLAAAGGSLLSDLAGSRLGRNPTLLLIHDGTAAARALSVRTRAAAITLGTSLGVGFTPHPSSLIPLSPEFDVKVKGRS